MIRLGEPNVQLHFCILECVHKHLTVNRSPLCIILFSRETANVIDAAARGATDAIFVVFAVVASLISFLSLLHFINAVINYLGELVDINDLSLDASIKKHCTFSQNRTQFAYNLLMPIYHSTKIQTKGTSFTPFWFDKLIR